MRSRPSSAIAPASRRRSSASVDEEGREGMATEVKSALEVRWPSGVRLPIVLTFEHQCGEGTPPRPGDRPNYLIGGQIEYGARRGVWNILELLDKLGVKATFMVSGL